VARVPSYNTEEFKKQSSNLLSAESPGTDQDDELLSLATLPAGLRLTVTGADTGRAQRGRTGALAGFGLAGAAGKTGVGGRIRHSQIILA
jgi:hypothetical protein